MKKALGKKLNLLVVDDDDDMLVLFYMAMRAKGYDVEVSRNAETFWEDLFYTHPDVIILDVHMPGIDGRVLCRRLKEHEYTAQIPVILLSANADLEHIAIETGANGYIKKPFTPEKVMQEVDRIMGKAA